MIRAFLANEASVTMQTWLLNSIQAGLLVLDDQLRVVMANDWFLRRARLALPDMHNKTLADIFPQAHNSRLEQALQQAVNTGFSSVLSEALHPSPLPLYAPSAAVTPANRLKQSIQIVPMGVAAAKESGQRYVLVQIADVTAAVARERLLRDQADRLHAMAHVDALTRIGNRRHFDEMLTREWGNAIRQRQPLSLILFDVDHFKLYNDLYGHQQGDACLKTVAGVVQMVARRSRDVACRYGGEELVMLLPDTDLAGAKLLADQVLDQVRELRLPHQLNGEHIVTLSAGVAIEVPEPSSAPEALLRRADQALYEAKQRGRDQVVVHTDG